MNRRRFGPSRRRHHRRGEAGAAAAQIAESGDGLRVGPLQVVDQEHEWPVLGHERDQGLEHLDLAEHRPRGSEAELGQDLRERRQLSDVDLDAGERVPERGRERHVRQVPLELGAAGTPDSDIVEPALQLVEQARLPEPRFALDLDQREVTAERLPGCARKRVELDSATEQPHAPVAGARPSLTIGRGSSESAFSCRRIADSSARVSRFGSSPSSSSSSVR